MAAMRVNAPSIAVPLTLRPPRVGNKHALRCTARSAAGARRALRVRAQAAAAPSVARSVSVTKQIGDAAKVDVSLGLDGFGSVDNHTGVPFLDHMLDQLGTHGLLDLSVKVEGATEGTTDEAINNAVGAAVGAAIAKLNLHETNVTAEFYSPLDESLQGVALKLNGNPQMVYNTTIPTKRVGKYETRLMEPFYQALVDEAKISVQIDRLTPARNCNSHHIIEATFKAFARAMRQGIDKHDGVVSAAAVAGTAVREAEIHRETGETKIDVKLTLDGKGGSSGTTTVPFLDRQLAELAATSGMSMHVDCIGDTHIDDHHTVEDTAIVIGSALQTALGDRAGINRMGFAAETVGEATVHATLDLSGRPHLGFDMEFADEWVAGGEFDTQLVEHTYQSLVNKSGLTLHIRRIAGDNSEDLILAAARAVGSALRMGLEYDARRAGKIASSKGVL